MSTCTCSREPRLRRSHRPGEFWGNVLGREVTPGVTAPEVVTVGTTEQGGRPQMVFHPAPEAERVIGGFVPPCRPSTTTRRSSG